MDSPEYDQSVAEDRRALQRGLQRERIRRRLRLVDPGSYAFYEDAVRLLEEGTHGTLNTLSHLIAHLLRELESSIRSALGPAQVTKPEWPVDRTSSVTTAVQKTLLDAGVDEADPLHDRLSREITKRAEQSHQWQIHATLDQLGVDAKDPVRSQWIELVAGRSTKLSYLAHRQALEGPRKLGNKLHELFETFEAILDTVLQRFEERFALYLRRVDDLLAIPSPTENDVDVLKHRLPNNPVIRGRFFERVENPAWVSPLMKRKVFTNIPGPEASGEGLTFPAWLPVFALRKLSEDATGHDAVGRVLMSLEATSNDWVNGHLMDVALKLPKEIAIKWVTREAARIQQADSLYLWYPMSCRKMIDRLADEGEYDAALALAKAILSLRSQADQKPSLYDSLAEIHGAKHEGKRKVTVMKVGQHDYAEIAGIVAGKLAPLLKLPVLEFLADLQTFAIENDGYAKEVPHDLSYIWRDSMAESERVYGGDAHQILVSPLRDAALSLASDSQFRDEVLRFLYGQKWHVFWRVGLYVAAKSLHPSSEEMRWLAADQTWGTSWLALPEYFVLLRRAFTAMTDDQKSACLAWAEQYPNIDNWKGNFEKEEKRAPTDAEVDDYKAYRSVRALWRIRDILPPVWAAKFESWSRKKAGKEAAEIASMPKGVRSVGGPKSAEKLGEMSVTQVFEFLEAWEPDTGISSTSDWAPDLARNVSADVKLRHDEYIDHSHRLLETQDPTWCTAVMSGLREVELDDGEWESVLHLCEQLVAWGPAKASPKAGRFPRSDFAKDMSWCRMSILEFLKQGLYTPDEHGGREFRHRESIWAMVNELANDPDPRTDDAVKSNDKPDYDMTALNRVRPQAVETAIWYGIWYVHHTRTVEQRRERAVNSTIKDTPGLGDLLSRHIAKQTEPHPSVWAVYGQHFARLMYLGRDWVEEHLNDMLPPYDVDEEKRSVVWRSFIKHYRGDWTTSEFLQGKFQEEVERLSPEVDDATDDSGRELDNRLALHLMIMLWWRAIELDGPLLRTFFDRAPDSVRAYAIWYLGKQYNDFLSDSKDKGDAADLLKLLWVARNDAAKAKGGKGYEQEMGAFLRFFTAGGPVHTPVVLDPKKDPRPVTFKGKQAFEGDDNWVLDRLIESLTWAKSSRAMYDTEVAKKFASYAGHKLQGKAIRALRLLVESHRADFGLPYWLVGANDLIVSAADANDDEPREECFTLINILVAAGIDTYRHLLPPERGGVTQPGPDQGQRES